MMPYPKCQHCGHSKTKHRNITFGQTGDRSYCVDCPNFIFQGATYDWEIDKSIDEINMYHAYHPDNLSYIEKLAERRGLV